METLNILWIDRGLTEAAYCVRYRCVFENIANNTAMYFNRKEFKYSDYLAESKRKRFYGKN